MMKQTLLTVAIIALFLSGCDKTATDGGSNQVTKAGTELVSPNVNARKSLDWAGIYSGIQPCADCSGIETQLTLNKDDTYALEQIYQGSHDAKPLYNEGKFKWNDRGDTITINLNDKQHIEYFVTQQRVYMLDKNGNRIKGELADAYALTKKNLQ